MSKTTRGLLIGIIIGVFLGATIVSLTQDFGVKGKDHVEALRIFIDDLKSSFTDSESPDFKLTKSDGSEKSSNTIGAYPVTPNEDDGQIMREYHWNYLDRTWSFSLAIPSNIAGFYGNYTRFPTRDYSVYVTHPLDDEYLAAVVDEINLMMNQTQVPENGRLGLVISFVQGLSFTYDNESTVYDEYPRFPVETLVYGGGDCEDKSILMAALLSEMGYDVILINPPGHMAVGLLTESSGYYWTYDGRDYYYLETTLKGWGIGECPDEFKVPAHLYPLTPLPVISFSWEGSCIDGFLDVSVTVENLGTAAAEGYNVWVACEDEDCYIWNPLTREAFNLGSGMQCTLDLSIQAPKDKQARLIVEVLNPDGYYIQRGYSDWFDT